MPLASSRAPLDGADEFSFLVTPVAERADGARGRSFFARHRRALSLSAMVVVSFSLLAVSTTTWTLTQRNSRRHESWHLLPSHCDGVNLDADAPVTDDVRDLISNATYVAGFWRLRHPSHHTVGEYARGLRETACKYGNRKVNVVFIEDAPDTCRMLMRWYRAGRDATSVHEPLGKGHVHCEVRTTKDFPLTMTQCRKAHVPVWVNKIPLFGEIVEKVHRGEISSKMRASKYFWVDADIGRIPGVIDQEFHQTYGQRGEDEEDKFWTKCYEPALPAPRRTPLGCGWLRHEVVANIFGGSAESIINYSKGYIRYVNLHVPTAQNGERPAAAVSCPCPTEEELMTTMSRDPKFEHLYGSKSCARRWRRRTRG